MDSRKLSLGGTTRCREVLSSENVGNDAGVYRRALHIVRHIHANHRSYFPHWPDTNSHILHLLWQLEPPKVVEYEWLYGMFLLGIKSR